LYSFYFFSNVIAIICRLMTFENSERFLLLYLMELSAAATHVKGSYSVRE